MTTNIGIPAGQSPTPEELAEVERTKAQIRAEHVEAWRRRGPCRHWFGPEPSVRSTADRGVHVRRRGHCPGWSPTKDRFDDTIDEN